MSRATKEKETGTEMYDMSHVTYSAEASSSTNSEKASEADLVRRNRELFGTVFTKTTIADELEKSRKARAAEREARKELEQQKEAEFFKNPRNRYDTPPKNRCSSQSASRAASPSQEIKIDN